MIARGLLALVVIALLGGTALAFAPRLRCTCGQDAVSLPRDGAVDVPTNARMWRLYRDTPVSSRALPEREPYTAYDMPSDHVSFTTGDGPDHEPPVEPRIGFVTIAVTGGSLQDRMDVAQMYIVGAFSPDTAVLRVKLFDGGRVITYYMRADKRLICEPGLMLHVGAIYGEVTAIDLAGNESQPAAFEAMSQFVPSFESTCPKPALPHSPWYAQQETGAFSFVPLVTLGLDVVGCVVIAMALSRRSRKRASATIEPLAITAAEQLARRIRLRSALTAVGLIGMVAGLAPLDPRVASELAIASPLVLWALWTTLASWWAATRLLRFTARNGAVTIVRHDLVEVALPDRRASLACPRRLVVNAQQNALPKATTL